MSSEQFRKAGDEIDKAIRQSDKRLTNTAIGKELEIDEATIRKVRNGEKAKRETFEKVYKYLSLDLNKLIAGVTTTKGIAQQRYGSYARQAVESTYGGNYITVRPRYAEPKKLKVYLTRIYWNEEENYLCFEEREREDSEFAQTGQVYIPDGSRIFLMTIRAGWVRTVQVSKPVGNSAILRGLITSQFDGGGGNFTPIVAPIVYIKMKPE
ncbi:MAG: hypothetical protein INH43_27505, partial [Acidobacteriaceae bacterium]|nr:hypothetical protein [Acidobacteriaceae bacterium]